MKCEVTRGFLIVKFGSASMGTSLVDVLIFGKMVLMAA
jgi:hypothetical protein